MGSVYADEDEDEEKENVDLEDWGSDPPEERNVITPEADEKTRDTNDITPDSSEKSPGADDFDPEHIGGEPVCTPGHSDYEDGQSAWPTVDVVYVDSDNHTPTEARDVACPLETEFRYQVDRYIKCRELPYEDGGVIYESDFQSLIDTHGSIGDACVEYAKDNFEPMVHNLIHFILNPADFTDTDSVGQNPTDNFHEDPDTRNKPSVSWTGFHHDRHNFFDARIFMHETYHAILPEGYVHHSLGEEYEKFNRTMPVPGLPLRSVMQYDTDEHDNCCGDNQTYPPDDRTWNEVETYIHGSNSIKALQYALDNYDWSNPTDGDHLVTDDLPDGCLACYT